MKHIYNLQFLPIVATSTLAHFFCKNGMEKYHNVLDLRTLIHNKSIN